MTDCQRKTLLGRPACRFEGRHDTYAGPPFPMWPPKMNAAETRAYGSSSTYVRDVCVKCGRTIERQSKESGGFFANLTPEQRKAAQEYRGPDHHGKESA